MRCWTFAIGREQTHWNHLPDSRAILPQGPCVFCGCRIEDVHRATYGCRAVQHRLQLASKAIYVSVSKRVLRVLHCKALKAHHLGHTSISSLLHYWPVLVIERMERRTQDLIREFSPKLLQAAASVCHTVRYCAVKVLAHWCSAQPDQGCSRIYPKAWYVWTRKNTGNVWKYPPLVMDYKHRGKDFSLLPLQILKAIGSETSHWLCCLKQIWLNRYCMTRYDLVWLGMTASEFCFQRLQLLGRLKETPLPSAGLLDLVLAYCKEERYIGEKHISSIFINTLTIFDIPRYTDIDVHFGISIADVAMRLWSEVRTCNGCKWPCPSGYKAWDAEYSEPRTIQDDVHSLHVAGPFADGPFRTTSQPFAEFQCGSMQHCSSVFTCL